MVSFYSQQPHNRDARLLSVFLIAFAIRFGLQFTSLPARYGNLVGISTPVTSYTQLQEGSYLYNTGIDPYDGGVCHQAPLLLAVLTFVQSLPAGQILEKLMYSTADLATGLALLDIGSSEYVKTRAGEQSFAPWVLTAIALLNPLSIITATARSSAIFNSMAIAFAMSSALSGKILETTFFLALATYMSVHPLLLTVPLVLVIADQKGVSTMIVLLQSVASLGVFIVAMLYSSYHWLGSWNFISTTYDIVLQMTDLTPNIGLWWYFFTEIFEDFRNFFLGMFQMHMLIYVVPLCIKIRKDPLFVAITLTGVIAIFKPYPSIADTNLYLTLLPLYSHLFQHTRYLFVVACALLYCCIFGPAFYYLWIYAGSGNANFFYAITLVWNLAQGFLLTDVVFACLKNEWELAAPESRLGKGLEVVQLAD